MNFEIWTHPEEMSLSMLYKGTFRQSRRWEGKDQEGCWGGGRCIIILYDCYCFTTVILSIYLWAASHKEVTYCLFLLLFSQEAEPHWTSFFLHWLINVQETCYLMCFVPSKGEPREGTKILADQKSTAMMEMTFWQSMFLYVIFKCIEPKSSHLNRTRKLTFDIPITQWSN